jgi:hypothetical protein
MHFTSPRRVSRPPHHRPAGIGILLLTACLWMSQPVFAGFDSDCHALKLKSASGVPQSMTHGYHFSGTCNILFDSTVLITVPAAASATWDGTKHQLEENFKVLATVKYPGVDDGNTHYNGGTINPGPVSSVFKCNDDPLVTNASCITTSHINQSDFPQFSNPANQNRPLLKGKTSLAEAQALSQKSASGAASPPPPAPKPNPKKKMLSKPSAPTRLGGLVTPQTGFNRSGGSASTVKNPPLVAKRTEVKGLPDITSGAQIQVGTQTASWGGNVTVDAKDAHSVNMNNDGLCEFFIKQTARNIGLASTGSFDSVWRNGAVPGGAYREWLSIAAGGSKQETDIVRLKAGANLLSFTLDNTNKVHETSESNNLFRVNVTVTGSCGPKPGLAPALRSAPAGAGTTRVPAVQNRR